MKKQLRTCETYLEPTGRIIIGAFFLLAGLSKFIDLAEITAYIASVGLPMATFVALLAGAFEVLAGLALITGKYTRYAALLLAGFTLLAAALFHNPSSWAESPIQQVMFMKNMAIMGGLLFMSAHVTSTCHLGKTEKTKVEDTQI